MAVSSNKEEAIDSAGNVTTLAVMILDLTLFPLSREATVRVVEVKVVSWLTHLLFQVFSMDALFPLNRKVTVRVVLSRKTSERSQIKGG